MQRKEQMQGKRGIQKLTAARPLSQHAHAQLTRTRTHFKIQLTGIQLSSKCFGNSSNLPSKVKMAVKKVAVKTGAKVNWSNATLLMTVDISLPGIILYRYPYLHPPQKRSRTPMQTTKQTTKYNVRERSTALKEKEKLMNSKKCQL